MRDHPDINFDDLDDEVFRAIGEFIYSFSQLEITMRLRLADALQLKEGLFEVVVGPYDFATLCNVLREVLKRTRTDLDSAVVAKLFNRCLALNQLARVVIAHATWYPEGGGASHFSKNTFQRTSHFADVKDIRGARQRLSANWPRTTRNWEPGDRPIARESPPLAGLSA